MSEALIVLFMFAALLGTAVSFLRSLWAGLLVAIIAPALMVNIWYWHSVPLSRDPHAYALVVIAYMTMYITPVSIIAFAVARLLRAKLTDDAG